MPRTRLAIERRGVRRREVGRQNDAGLDHGGLRRVSSYELGDDLARHSSQVFGSSREVLVVEAAVLGRHRLGCGVPGLGCVLALLEDPAAGRLEQLVVLEVEEMGVEDRRAVIPGAGGDGVAARISARTSRGPAGAPPTPPAGRLPAPWEFRAPAGGSGERPSAIPGAAGSPTSAPGGPACGRATGGVGGSTAASSSKSRAASASSAASTSPACGPLAATAISWPWRTPRVAIALRLRRSRGRVPSSRS